MFVAGVASNTLSVVRGYGGTTAVTLADNMVLNILGNAALEGDDAPLARFTSRVRKQNYTQIFTATVDVSGSLQASRSYGVDDEVDYQKQERLRELLRDLLADSLREPNLASRAAPLPATPPDLASLGPMGVLLAATLATRASKPDRLAIRAATDWLAQAWNADSADVIALQRWCSARRAGSAARKPHRPPPAAVPMLKTSWSLLFAGPPAMHLSASAQREIGWWRTASDLWLTTQRPAHGNFAKADQSLPLPTTPDGAPDLPTLADALRRPVAGVCPLQQSLRHAVLNAAEDDAEGNAPTVPLDAIVSTQARAAELDLPAVQTALQALWQAAVAQLVV